VPAKLARRTGHEKFICYLYLSQKLAEMDDPARREALLTAR